MELVESCWPRSSLNFNESSPTYQFEDARTRFLGRVISFEILGLVVKDLKISIAHNIVHFPSSNYHVDGFRLEKVEGLAVSLELLLLYAQQNRTVHLN